ncbi:MAG: thioredoxin domain-containing protein [Anaerolineae bacterium]|nr:thioredoxin domain-containing protein [Anaerolineae bacterium]
MATQTQDTQQESNAGSLWPTRATFTVGMTRRQRQQQFRQQMNALTGVLVVTLVVSAIVVISNWNNVGAVEAITCAAFPDFCVPLAGESTVYDKLEAADSRVLDEESTAAPGVVRYVGTLNEPRIGDPAAPIHFVTVSDYACPHCQDFHGGDLDRFIKEYVLTGQATFGFVQTVWTGRGFSELASQAALCAGEQGAFWEYSEELFAAADAESISAAFSLASLRDQARDMGLDADELEDCVSSARYAVLLSQNETFALDSGVTGTPTVLVSYGNGWTIVNRTFDSLVELTEAAHARANGE